MAVTEAQIQKAVALAESYGATRLILFGSALESLENARDLDLACDGVDGWEFFGLAAQIEKELRIPLDLVPLSPPSRFTRLIESRGRVLL